MLLIKSTVLYYSPADAAKSVDTNVDGHYYDLVLFEGVVIEKIEGGILELFSRGRSWMMMIHSFTSTGTIKAHWKIEICKGHTRAIPEL
jgi:hypothetical protein